MSNDSVAGRSLSRRSFLGAIAAASVAPTLAACGGGGSESAADAVKFWDMPWGPDAYTTAAKSVVSSYKASGGGPGVSYQQIPWASFYQTFASAVASGTGPAVSTGSAFMPYQFAAQGEIAYADKIVEELQSSGDADDFVPGTLEALKTDAGYVGVPWLSDIRMIWYRKSFLQKAGAEVPTDWPSYLDAARKLKKAGYVGFGTAAGPSSNWGNQAMISLMLNNGGGLFDSDGNPDCLNDRNVEAVEFVQQMVTEGIVDPAVIGYTTDNFTSDWKSGKIAMGYASSFWQNTVAPPDPMDLALLSPLTGPHGDTGTLQYLAAIMMYRDAPAQSSSEAFVKYYLDAMKVYWEKKVVNSLPVRKSIAELPAVTSDPQAVKAVKEWVPVAKTFNSQAKQAFPALAAIDGTPIVLKFAQQVYQGKTDAKTALSSLQDSIESVLKTSK